MAQPLPLPVSSGKAIAATVYLEDQPRLGGRRGHFPEREVIYRQINSSGESEIMHWHPNFCLDADNEPTSEPDVCNLNPLSMRGVSFSQGLGEHPAIDPDESGSLVYSALALTPAGGIEFSGINGKFILPETSSTAIHQFPSTSGDHFVWQLNELWGDASIYYAGTDLNTEGMRVAELVARGKVRHPSLWMDLVAYVRDPGGYDSLIEFRTLGGPAETIPGAFDASWPHVRDGLIAFQDDRDVYIYEPGAFAAQRVSPLPSCRAYERPRLGDGGRFVLYAGTRCNEGDRVLYLTDRRSGQVYVVSYAVGVSAPHLPPQYDISGNTIVFTEEGASMNIKMLMFDIP